MVMNVDTRWENTFTEYCHTLNFHHDLHHAISILNFIYLLIHWRDRDTENTSIRWFITPNVCNSQDKARAELLVWTTVQVSFTRRKHPNTRANTCCFLGSDPAGNTNPEWI